MKSRYKINEELGRGAMGEVHLAEDIALGRKIALKFLAPELESDEDFLDRMRREARAVAALNHPNIVQIYDFGKFESPPYSNRTFISMEYVEGQSLKLLLKDSHGLTTAKKLDIARQICEALAYAHEQGVTHRDIKPDNVLVSAKGQVKLVDFGLAKSANVSRNVAKGQIMGTPHYMSPEQAEGEEQLDHRSDIFSFGVVLYEMLTGERPFKGETFPVVKNAIQNKKPRPLSHFNKEYSSGLQKIIDKTLAKNRNKRYQTALEIVGALKHELRHFVEGTTIITAPPAKTGAGHRWGSRLKASMIVVALLALLLVAIRAGVFTLKSPVSSEPEPVPPRSKLTVVTNPAGANVFVDNASIGVTPLRGHDVSDFSGILSIRKPYYSPVDTLISLFAPDSLALEIPLQELVYAEINITPPDAEFFLDGEPIEKERLAQLILPTGGHAVRVSRSGYQSTSEVVTLSQGDTTLSFALNLTEPERDGVLRISSEPESAAIYFGQTSTNRKTPHTFSSLRENSYEIVLKKTGYTDSFRKVWVFAGDTINAHFTLLPALGRVHVRTLPQGENFSLTIDGEVKSRQFQNEYEFVEAPGAYTLRIESERTGEFASLPKWILQKEIVVDTDTTTEVTVEFTRTVRLRVLSFLESGAGISAKIFVDGSYVGDSPTNNLEVSLGLHHIMVEREGYVLIGEPVTRNFEEVSGEPLKFYLRKK